MKENSIGAVLPILLFFVTVFPVCGSDSLLQRETPLTQEESDHFVMVARSWISRLWKTNDVYCGSVTLKNLRNPAWTHHRGVWTNEFLRSTVSIRQKPVSAIMPWKCVRLEFHITVANRCKDCWFEFLNDGRDQIIYVHNFFYSRNNIPYKYGDWKPIHTDEQQARQKASEYATMFGVSNLWDKSKFELRSFSLTDGVWIFDFTPFINGYPTLYPVSIRIADLPGYPLGEWLCCLYQIPTNLPTKVVLTSEEGREKGIEYLKKHFPLKELIPKLTFHSNRLEYIHPDYNYIRPVDDTGFSDYKPKWDEVALVWNNAFQKPEGTGFPWVHIYVDAATGEMLGGCD